MVSFSAANCFQLRMADQVERLNVEELVKEVERHPALWDATCEGYSNKHERDRGWQEVIASFLPDYQERSKAERLEIETLFRRRWKSMRTCYARELNRQKHLPGMYRRKYIYYDLLRFLDPVMSGPVTDAAKPKKPTRRAVQETSIETPSPVETSVAPREEHKPVARKTPVVRRHHQQDEADRLFLMSMVPDFQKVPDRNKMRLKREILEAIERAQGPQEMEEGEAGFRTPSTSREVDEAGFGSFMDFAEVKMEAVDYSSADEMSSQASSLLDTESVIVTS